MKHDCFCHDMLYFKHYKIENMTFYVKCPRNYMSSLGLITYSVDSES